MNYYNNRKIKVLVNVIVLLMILNCFSIPVSKAASTDWLGFWGGSVRSGDGNPFVHDAAKAHIKPCTTLQMGQVHNKAAITIEIKYFKDGYNKLTTNRSKKFTWPKKQLKVSEDMSTGWLESTVSDSYAIGADIHFTGYCYEHCISLDKTKYIPEE